MASCQSLIDTLGGDLLSPLSFILTFKCGENID